MQLVGGCAVSQGLHSTGDEKARLHALEGHGVWIDRQCGVRYAVAAVPLCCFALGCLKMLMLWPDRPCVLGGGGVVSLESHSS